jgi:SAM-dependent methyltransferase
MAINEEKLHALMGKMVNELGAAANAALVVIGDKLGLYRTLAEHGPLASAELAERTDTYERYVREWLAAQAATGLIDYDPSTGRFNMNEEQATVLADEDSTVFMVGGFQGLGSVFANEPRLTQAFKTGAGVGWDEHCGCLFCGTERFFRPGYRGHLVSEWLPALEGVTQKLERGALVADIGCGHGASTVIMAEAFSNSRFVGFDYHEGSIQQARSRGRHLANVAFEVARAEALPGEGYDLVTIFDALHDMGNPVAVARRVRSMLADDGTLMLVEPMAGDRLEDNLNPIGRIFYAFSTNLCVPASLNQDGRAALGAQAGESRLASVLREAGFTAMRRAAATPFNMIIEARP